MPWRLDAISLGYTVPQNEFDASVHSVFQSVVNLKLKRGWDLLTLVVSSRDDLSMGIREDTPQGCSFKNLHKKERGICHDGILHFGKTPMVVDLRNVES